MTQPQFLQPSDAAPLPRATRRGECPTLTQPMQTGDGLLARFRPIDSRLSSDQLRAIAILARRHGNGQIEITARGNLQVRGLTEWSTAPFAAAIRDLVAIETGLPIDLSPLPGLDGNHHADPRPLAAAIRQRLDAEPLELALGPKVGIVIDADGSLAALGADIRLTAIDGDTWQLAVDKTEVGTLTSSAAIDAVMTLLRAIARLGPDGRGRMLEQASITAAIGKLLPVAGAQSRPKQAWMQPLADGSYAVRLALAFGASDDIALTALANAADDFGVTALHPAAHHGLIALGLTAATAAGFRQLAEGLGFITTPDDPRRTISACVGSEGCGSGQIPTRAIAANLTASEPALFDGSFTVHVSGCAKGCAHPRSALLTLVGDERGCGLVIAGTAGHKPLAQIENAGIAPAIGRLAALWRARRSAGESAAACFKRLGDAAILAAVRQG